MRRLLTTRKQRADVATAWSVLERMARGEAVTPTQTVLLDVLAEVFGAVDFFLDVQEQQPTFDVVQAEAWHRLRRVHERLRAVVGERGGRG